MSIFEYKEIVGIIAILMIIPQTYIYIQSILQGETKPHIYTKIIWFILTGIGFSVQIENGGGPGSWVMGATCLVQLLTLILAIKYGTKDITRLDSILLALAFFCIPIYIGIEETLYALVFVIFIDMLGYIPTIRKTYNSPFSESLGAWNLSNSIYLVSIFAILEYSFYTLAYPIFLLLANGVLILIMVVRRRVLIEEDKNTLNT